MDEFFDIDESVDDVEEFDIQPRVLKKRGVVANPKVFVEYDRLTFNVIAVSPTEIEISSSRNLIAEVDPSKITNLIFENKLPLSKLRIKKNSDSNKFEVILFKQRHKSEFDFVFATDKEQSYIHLVCDVISKNIHIIFNSDIFKQQLAVDKTTERDLEELPDYIEIYCIDKTERSRLWGKFLINTRELFEMHELTYKCTWLPDDYGKLSKVGFVYYNDNQVISIGHSKVNEHIKTDLDLKPNLIYMQQGNVLKLQSTIRDSNSYKLGENIELFMYKRNDPSMMLGSIKLKSEQLNNYNQFEVNLNTEKEIKLLCNYLHLHAKEENANTYY